MRSPCDHRLRPTGRSAALLLAAAGLVLGGPQATSAQVGQTPPALLPGAPAGSYPVSDLEQVNLFNGNMLIRLQLLELKGRGDGAVTVTLPIEQHWRADEVEPNSYFPMFNWWRLGKPGYGPGHLVRYIDGFNNGGTGLTRLTRIVFVSPDGTEYEFRDMPDNVDPDDGDACLVTPGEPCVRSSIFQTRDGSHMTFVSETPITDYDTDLTLNGFLALKDGTHYTIVNGEIKEMRDRNGNRFTFAYTQPPQHDNYAYTPARGPQPSVITDSLNRQVTFAYALPYNAGTNPNPTDFISFTGFAGAPRTIQVRYSKLAASLIGGQSIGTLPTLFPNVAWGDATTLHNPLVVSAVVLPDTRQYTFRYNAYGETAELTLPTGGRIEYVYVGAPSTGPDIVRRVSQRTVYPDPAAPTSARERTNYGGEQGWPNAASPDQVVFVDQVDPQNFNQILRQTRHYFFGRAGGSFLDPTELPYWRLGREFRTEVYEGGTTKLRQVDNVWDQEDPDELRILNPRVTSTTTTLSPTNEVSRRTFGYDDYNNRTRVVETDYAINVPGPDVRKTETDYVTTFNPEGPSPEVNYATELAIHIRNLPLQTRVFAGVGNGWVEKSRTTFDYDNYIPDDDGHGEMLVYGSTLTGIDPQSLYAGAYTYRGNLTTTWQWLDDPPDLIATYRRYANTGNVIAEVDARGHETTLQYAEHFGGPNGSLTDDTTPTEIFGFKTHAFPTIVTNALGHQIQSQIDYYLGEVVDLADPNGTVSTRRFGDALDRPTAMFNANRPGSDSCAIAPHPESARMAIEYRDSRRLVRTRTDRNTLCDGFQRSETVYDGFGREIETRTFEVQGLNPDGDPADEYIAVQKTYDALGRVHRVSNPFRVKPTNPETPIWTTRTYDALDRPLTVATPDGQVVQTQYSGPTTTMTDQASKVRQSTADALGRVRRVVEAPGSLNYETTYTYSVLDQVETVSQPGQLSRTFAYDSLGRLKSTHSPEGGTVTYIYDPNGNVRERSDGRVTVTYQPYDKLNRPLHKSYTPTLSPAVTYSYDDAAAGYAIGRLTGVTNGVSATEYGYDRLGRISDSRQITGGVTYPFSYGYDRAANLTSRTYPSGRTVTVSHDRPGRITSVQPAGSTTFAFANQAQYASHGAIVRLRLGNERWESTTAINSRLQPETMGLGTSSGGLDLLRLDYSYDSTKGPGNNGNMRRQVITAQGHVMTQDYTYDEVNRLETAEEAGAWSQRYGYDSRGNRAVVENAGHQLSGLTPTSLGQFDANNQITAGQTDYDLSGNQKKDALGRIFEYDGDSRLISFTGVGAPPPVTYKYDGEGRRVSRQQLTGERVFVYDAFGQLAAEYATIAGTGVGVQYATPDHLGSVRAVTNDSGVIARHDFLPFGEEIAATLGSRSQISTYGPFDAFRHRFAGKERDNESGLDFLQARYHSGAQGRFTSPDPFLSTPHHIADPQRWNRYTYARNNPLRFVDPDGSNPRVPPMTPLQLATFGEKVAADLLRQEGYQIVLAGARKHAADRGFDIVARKGSEVLIVDNKAFLSRATASTANALTKGLEANIAAALADIRALIKGEGSPSWKRKARRKR